MYHIQAGWPIAILVAEAEASPFRWQKDYTLIKLFLINVFTQRQFTSLKGNNYNNDNQYKFGLLVNQSLSELYNHITEITGDSDLLK